MGANLRLIRPVAESKPSYHEIHALTGVSVTSISRVARTFVLPDHGFRMILDRLQTKRRKPNRKRN